MNALAKKDLPVEALIEEMCAALGHCAPEEAYRAARSRDLWVGTEFNESGRYSKLALLTERYESPEALAAGLANRDPEVRGASMALLSRLDMAAAAPYAIVLAWQGGEIPWFTVASPALQCAVEALPAAVGTLSREDVRKLWREGLLRHHPKSAVPAEIQRQASSEALTLPPDEVLQLWLKGCFDSNAVEVPLEIRRKVSLGALLDALRQGHLSFKDQSEIEDVLGSHPALATLEQRVTLFERLAPGARTDGESRLVRWLMQRLGRDHAEQAVPLLLRLREQYGRWADDALLQVGTPAALDPLVAEFESRLSKVDLTWDPHHVEPSLEVPIQAIFRLDPATAVDRLGRFFSEKALATDVGAKLAHDILSIGGGIAVAHTGLVYATTVGDVLSADPRWLDVAARLAHHRLLSRTAKEILARAEPRVRREALERARAAEVARRPTIPAPVPEPRWLQRYLAGEQVQVWDEIHALGAEVDPAHRIQIEGVVRETMARVRTNLEQIVAGLRRLGSIPKRALGTAAESQPALSALQKLVGVPLPLTVRGFYETVGAVDLSCTGWWRDASNEVHARLDPLVIVAAKGAVPATKRVRAFAERGLPRDLKALTEPFVCLAPGTTGDVSGEDADEAACLLFVEPNAVDGVVLQWSRQMYFVDYLRARCAGAGFEALYGALGAGYASFARDPVEEIAPELKPIMTGLVPL